ncbi:hypothetical protein BHE74_00016488 [Ensete ventricosum]|uniref:Uncharacterized protein n=1 Tax=Ensete ventricosum TaxID=4639 RepID=A0A444GA47_ENSVE|nr:hypothetical protein GW17_00003621 [Ensete ventricosum]RWW75495.1 hypothetical protein BHE74_00016488 [Ensete ventricosum]RZR73917.1 hypothetical protein BHM03_00029619 [Ensete ventricosum]
MSYTDSPSFVQGCDSLCTEEILSSRESLSIEQESPLNGTLEETVHEEASSSNLVLLEEDDKSPITNVDASADVTESSDTESTDEEPPECIMMSSAAGVIETDPKLTKIASVLANITNSDQTAEDFTTWQRIMRLDAIRANAEWIVYSPARATVSMDEAIKFAVAVGLKDYDHLEPCRIYHAARLVAVLEAYALYDPEVGYCQGMSDLLSPILAVMEEDHEAFWCFVGFMKKARHNFRLDEAGIQRQLNIVSKIIKSKDPHLYRHLEKLQAEDCFFVYRMVVVVFRRELTFEQTLCLWEVMWADQAAIRAGIGKSVWGRIRLRAPPTDYLLLYAIAASVLQRRKLIIERYSSMDEIMRECNSMAGQLDVWKLLDDAHDLVPSPMLYPLCLASDAKHGMREACTIAMGNDDDDDPFADAQPLSALREPVTSSLRRQRLLRQPDYGPVPFPVHHLELNESDVLWSSASDDIFSAPPSAIASGGHDLVNRLPSPTPAQSSPLPLPSSPSDLLGLPFGPETRGLTAALAEDLLPLVHQRRPAARATWPVATGNAGYTSGASRVGRNQSAPVNIPAWPRCRRGWKAEVSEEEAELEDAEEEEMVPPHVMVARLRATTCTVFEGVGRTLRGRDLRRVRNAVLQKTGFLES